MKNIFVFTFILLFLLTMNTKTTKAQVTFGIFADCQYCNCETAGSRYYKNSLVKLEDCVVTLNENKNIEFVVGLGDLIDRDFSSFDSVLPILNLSDFPIYNIIGNHDLEVEENKIANVPEKIKLEKTYYSLKKNDWLFVFLNGSEITYKSADQKIKAEAERLVNQLTAEKKPNNKIWNGGISKTQLLWLENELIQARKESRKVTVFCHYPLLPLEAHTLWNSEEVLAVLKKYPCIKLFVNGHNHAGNYAFQHGIHFVTLLGMVETEKENSFATISLQKNNIKIEGFGREMNQTLSLK